MFMEIWLILIYNRNSIIKQYNVLIKPLALIKSILKGIIEEQKPMSC